MENSDWIALAGVVVSAIVGMGGGLLLWVQLRSGQKIKRMELVAQIVNQCRFSDEMMGVFYLFDYGVEWYNDSFHNTREPQGKVDKFLSYLSYLCWLKSVGALTKIEFGGVGYMVARSLQNGQVQCYLWNLYHWSKKMGAGSAFVSLIEYGLKERFVDRVVFENSDDKVSGYTKRLNF
ncbi:MAG: hypothetical protein FWD76_00980 [Firmicutes bacterium]|nr:hypothetical protein [Bacillota bacterium]